MKIKVDGKLCNTETSNLLGVHYFGVFGDPAGYEERLYRNRVGTTFMYGRGGADSPYPEETIQLMNDELRDKWEADDESRL